MDTNSTGLEWFQSKTIKRLNNGLGGYNK